MFKNSASEHCYSYVLNLTAVWLQVGDGWILNKGKAKLEEALFCSGLKHCISCALNMAEFLPLFFTVITSN